MGYAGVPTDRPTTAKATTDGKGSPPRGLVVIVVIMVAVMLLLATLSLRTFINVSEEPTSHIEDGVLVVTGDEVWEGRSGVLKTPVEVKRRGSLTIRGCDLQVEIERMLVSDRPCFSGYPGSRMVLEDSTVTVVADPDFDRIVSLDVQPYYGWEFDDGLFMMWRAVDLGTMEQPVLSLDVKSLGRHGDLLVAVQPSPGEPMEAMDTISFEKGVDTGWETCTVDLSAYAGDIVGLSVSTTNDTLRGLLMKDVRVTDPVVDPTGAAFPTGMPPWDDWYSHGLATLESWMTSYELDPLFSTEGDLTFRCSSLSAPPIWWDQGTDVGEASKTILTPDREGFNTMSLAEGPDVHVWGGSVLMDDCTLDNVTVEATHSEVTIQGSHFVADREMVTLFRCWGELTDCTFRSAYSFEAEGIWIDMDDPDLWAVSIWGLPDDLWGVDPTGPYVVSGCDFRDSIMGLDLAHTRLRLEDCTFDNIHWIGVWDHGSEGLGMWEDLLASNGFTDCDHLLYLRTHDCTLTYHHENRSLEGWDYNFRPQGMVRRTDADWLPTFDELWARSATADVYMPTIWVNSTGDVFRPEWVEVWLSIAWAGVAVERVPTNATESIVDFTGRNEYGTYDEVETDIWWPSLWPSIVASPGTGRLDLELMVDIVSGSSYYFPAPVRDMEVEIRLDGDLEETVDAEEEGTADRWGDLHINRTLDVPPGLHVFNFTLTAVLNDTGERTYLDGWNYSIARADANTTNGDVRGWLDELFPIILLDPGTEYTLTSEDIPPGDTYYYWYWWMVFLGEGAVLKFSGLPRAEFDSVYLRVEGPGGLVLDDLDLQYMSFNLIDGWARLSNVSSGYSEIWTEDGDVQMEDCSITLDWSSFVRSNATFRRCQLNLSHSGSWENVVSTIKVSDCHLWSDRGDFTLPVGNGDVRFIDSTFTDMDITFAICDSRNGTLEVSGCDLRGEAGFITLTSRIYWTPGYFPIENASLVSISENTLSGADSGISADRWLFQDSIRGNTLEDGAGHVLWYNCSLQLAPANLSHDYSHFAVIATPGQDLVHMDFYQRWREDRNFIVGLKTQEEDPLAHTPVLQVTITLKGTAQWFAQVDMGELVQTIPVPDWGEPVMRLHELLNSGTDNFWED